MSSQNRTIAFFGATGGTGAAALASALRAGHHSTALIRDPSKLLNILRTQHNIPDSTLSTHLTTIAGSAKSVEDVSKALISPHNKSHLVDTIFTSLGSFPKPQFSLRQPLVLVDPTICQDAMATTFAAIDDLASRGVKSTEAGKKSALVIVSGTTSEDIWGEVPWKYLIGPLYTYLLSSPHQDKMATEALLRSDKGAHLRDFVIVRPSFLTEGNELGKEKLRVGWTWSGEKKSEEKEERGVVGWTVSKRDLGAWVHENVLGGSEGETLGWEGKVAKVTY